MIYPAVIMTVAAIAIVVLLIFVIPVFQNMFVGVNLALPLPTRIVIGLSTFLKGYWWAIGRRRRRRRWHAPPRSTTPRPTASCRSTGCMLQRAGAGRRAPQVGGVAVHPHARHADQLGRQHPRRPRDHGQDRRQPRDSGRDHGVARQSIAGGDTIAAPLEKSQVFPPMVISHDRRRRADRRSRRDALQDRRLLRRGGGRRRERTCSP